MASVRTKVVGTTFRDGYPQSFYGWAARHPRDYPKCELKRDPTSEHDPNAVRVYVARKWVGHIPSALAARVAELMDSGVKLTARVVNVEVIPDLPAQPTMTIEIARPSGAPNQKEHQI